MAGEGTELIMLGNLRMCQEVFAFWEIEVRRIDKPENKTVYICGLGASVRYEQLSEYLTRSD